MKTTRIYLKGCDWCNASGLVPSNNWGMNTTPLTDTCPVCNGAKTIVVTEVTESDASQRSELTDKMIEKGIREYYNSSDFLKLSDVVIYDRVKGAIWYRDRQKGGKP